MNDDLHPTPSDTELLASALVDGTLTADDAAAAATPEVSELAEGFTTVRTVLGDVAPAPAEARDRAMAAALAAYDELYAVPATAAPATAAPAALAPVFRLADRRRWPSRVLAAAAAVIVLGVVGVTVFQSPADDESSASDTTNVATAEIASADRFSEPTIGAINAPASPAIAVHSPEELLTLAEAKMAPAPLESAPATSIAGDVMAGQAGSGSPALGCLAGDQVFIADILYNGRPAIAAHDTVTGVTQAIDEQCNVLAEGRALR